ncbi:MAG: outer-membrane lipoprotein carrier protein LolA [Candidatus Acidiferrum sp.]
MLLLATTPAVTSQTPSQRFEALYRSARTLRAEFLERYSENGKLVRAEAGTAYFRKSGKMRWEYEKPEKNLFLVDGRTAWLYTPADHTATKVPARQSEDWRTPFVLLSGEMKLSRVCAKVESTPLLVPGQSGDATLECKLREAATARNLEDVPPRVFFEISGEGKLVRLVVRSAGGIETEFQFKNWEINPPVPDSLFRFSPPLGVVIVDGLLPSSSDVRQ